MELDQDACYRAVRGRDRRFDGVFYTAVRTTGIYCRPSCPALTPRRANVTFYPSAAAAQGAGFRACRRCLPDATPGSPDWDLAAEVAGRGMRLIADGVVEREGVEGLSGRLGYSVRQVNRLMTAEFGAGPLALARSRRAQTARVLIETTGLSFAETAFAAGFASIRQFNDTIREVYATTPTALRGRRGGAAAPGSFRVRIAVREPFDLTSLLSFLAVRAVPGVEVGTAESYERSVRLPYGPGVLRIDAAERTTGAVGCRWWLADARDLAPAVERTRRLLDADSDPVAVGEVLGADPFLGELLRRRPGLRVPGHLDGEEMAIRAVLGQQVGLAAARTAAAGLVADYGEPLELDGPQRVDRLFPSAARLARLDPGRLPGPAVRARALTGLAATLAEGSVRLDRSADRAEVRERLLSLPGIGPWTAGCIALRALGDPDVLLLADLAVRRSAAALGIADLRETSVRWAPWRSYAQLHLWSALADPPTPATSGETHDEGVLR